MKFAVILYGLLQLLRISAWRDAGFRKRLKEKNFTAQLRTKGGTVARWYTFENGKVRSKAGLHPSPEVVLEFKDATLAARLMTPPIDYQQQIDAHGTDVGAQGGFVGRVEVAVAAAQPLMLREAAAGGVKGALHDMRTRAEHEDTQVQ